MKQRLLLPVLLLTFSLALSAAAKDVAGVAVPETAAVADRTLPLNGAGVRSRFFVKVYVGALYLPERAATMQAALATPLPKSVRLHIVYGEIPGDQLTQALQDGFAANQTAAELEALTTRIERFRALFPTVRRGDLVRLDLLPDGSTDVWINAERRGAIAGADFQNALLAIWLGEKPADKSLKRAMLGQE